MNQVVSCGPHDNGMQRTRHRRPAGEIEVPGRWSRDRSAAVGGACTPKIWHSSST